MGFLLSFYYYYYLTFCLQILLQDEYNIGVLYIYRLLHGIFHIIPFISPRS
jgi:hypothetical protein